MKTLVFSDSHLSPRFDSRKLAFLKKIVNNTDRVIINGDFWEGYEWSFDQFINSPWKELFPLLKKKQTVYLYGNHDKKEFADRRANLFSARQTRQYKVKLGKNTFYFEHGDRIVPFTDHLFKTIPAWLAYFYEYVEKLTVVFTGMFLIKLYYGQFNDQIKRKVASHLKKNEYLVCGHTSCAQIDLENHYLNSGWVKHGIGQYIMIEDGVPGLHDERY